jgi:hypothetical protein
VEEIDFDMMETGTLSLPVDLSGVPTRENPEQICVDFFLCNFFLLSISLVPSPERHPPLTNIFILFSAQ